jgi:hypothetical protein
VLGLFSLRHSALARLESGHVAADVLDRELRAALPARALLLVADQTALRLDDAELEQRSRPDLRWLPLRHFEHAEHARLPLESLPELAPLLRDWLLSGELPVAALQSLAAQRPLLLELTVPQLRSARDELVEMLAPYGPLLRASSSPLIASDLALAAKHQAGMRAADAALVRDGPVALRAWVEQRRRAEILLYRRAAPDEAQSLVEAAGLADDPGAGP